MHGSVAIARDLIAIPSVNPMGAPLSGDIYSERNVASYVDQFLKKLTIDSKITGRDPAHPNVIGYLDVRSHETLLLEAHMDTVSHENMVIEPFEPIVRDGLLYGRGSCDTKASLATYLYALSHVVQTGRRLKRNVLVVGVHDEEYSFGGSRELVDNGIRATFAIVFELADDDVFGRG